MMFYRMMRDAEPVSGAAQANQRVRVDQLEDRLDRALLACEALWTMLRDRLGISEEDLIERVNLLDLSDGQLDGKVRKPPVSCPRCQRTIASRFSKCMYCGQPIMHDPFA